MSTSPVYTTVRVERSLMPAIKQWALRHGITTSQAITQLCSAGLIELRDQPVAPRAPTPEPVTTRYSRLDAPTNHVGDANHVARSTALAELAAAVNLLHDTIVDSREILDGVVGPRRAGAASETRLRKAGS